ncbi:MAG: hypothetical protein KDK91_27860, partial [Gammaproteobacteria bacterium]|nr:hypothetical protein [Gammaproteobacteria bacterium]
MKIVDMQVRLLRIPTSLNIYQDVSARFAMHSFCLVELRTEDGLSGIGDAFCWGCEHAVSGMLNHTLKDRVLGQDATRIRALTEQLFRSMGGTGLAGVGAFALAGIEIALWDL